jgi:hypothetical protein
MKRITILLAAAALVLAVLVPTVLASGGSGTRIVLKAAGAFPAAKGHAKFKATAEERELQVEIEHIRRLAGKRVAFFVADKKLGIRKVNAFGAARIERSSERGQAVPSVRTGTRVVVRTLSGVKVVSGSF